ncbi:MAG: zonular occludens toxin domain-containing protein [Pseudomonadota bacterium]
MINLLLGAPGGGKSYEAVVFHILPALEKGRKVITNLPLNVERIAAIDPAYSDLIEKRDETRAVRPASAEAWTAYPFSHVEDYGDPWRHPESGAGPLYVIDECHIALPKIGTPRDVEHWYSLHRHESADVLLITQSYGKINQSIRDLVQLVYRVRKNIAFGSPTSYTRKVQDGLRGEVVNTTIRKYKRQFFDLYKSHTRGGGAELQAQDVRPIWKHWTFIGAGVMAVLFVAILSSSDKLNPMDVELKTPQQSHVVKVAHAPPSSRSVQPVTDAPQKGQKPEPYKANGLHIIGSLHMGSRSLYTFTVSQNGQPVATVTSVELVKLGYTWEPGTECAGWLTWDGSIRSVTCDFPKVGPI